MAETHRIRGKVTQDPAGIRVTDEVIAANDTFIYKGEDRMLKRILKDAFAWRKSKQKSPFPTERQFSPEHNAGFFSLVTFQWMAPLIRLGYERPLELHDVWAVSDDRRVLTLQTKMAASFESRQREGDKAPLRKALYDTFRTEFLIGGICSFVTSIVQVLSPFAVRFLINYASDAYIASRGGQEAPPISYGIGWVVGITLLQVLQTTCFNQFIYRGMMVGGQARAVLIALILDKAIKISGRAKAGGLPDADRRPAGLKTGSKEETEWLRNSIDKLGPSAGGREGWSNGRIVNLMSMDTSRINNGSIMIHILWTSPVSILLALALLLVNINYSALPGFALLVLVAPFLAKMTKAMIARRVKVNTITDLRASFLHEILQGVQFIKYFSWESFFLDKLASIRSREIKQFRAGLNIRHVITAIGTSMSPFAAMLSFVTYALSGHELRSSYVFSSLSLFGALSMPLNQLPLILGHVTDAAQSILRIQEFLLAEEAQDPVNWDFENENAIVLKDASFTWERNIVREVDGAELGEGKRGSNKVPTGNTRDEATAKQDVVDKEEVFALADLNLTVDRRELIAVIGPVGSGKSSLLSALAGDMRMTGGTIMIGASRAFCPQSAWIQNASIRENITMGQHENPSSSRWYDEVLDACALRPDLELFTDGDLTEVGERGITISGGQKQRLNIARAIYSNADLILMDDPLSAVDAYGGQHIMDKPICGLLKDKCRILVTHQLHVLRRCDRIVCMSEGRIVADGTFAQLMADNPSFQRIMATVAHGNEQEELQHDEKEVAGEQSGIEQKSAEAAPVASAAQLMQEEERPVTNVGWSIYRAYARLSGNTLNLPVILLLLIAAHGSIIATSLWLSWWTANQFKYSLGKYIGIYVALGFAQILASLVFYVYLTRVCSSASRNILQTAVGRVLHSPMYFFDTTPLGRITNRFSRDVDVMDNNLPDSLRNFLIFSGQIIAVFILVLVYFPYFAIAMVVLAVIFISLAQYYRYSARELKRHEAILRSHVFSRFGEAVSGIPTIRAYKLEQKFATSVNQAVDDMNGAYFLTFATQAWLAARLDLIGNLVVFTVGILIVTSRISVDPSSSGLVLSSILSVAQYFPYAIRFFADMENNMNSTERLLYYATEIEQEGFKVPSSSSVQHGWPGKGEIIFEAVQMRYREELPLILHNLSMRIAPGERVGIVGRTGAGKSSIATALFRIVELAAGRITIDGVDIATIGLHDLRSRLSIITQEPVLFQGTIRSNLDPLNEHSDLELWSALRQSGIMDQDQEQITDEKRQRIHLDGTVEEGGANFSLGQRQLLALSRALVRNSQIIVCDEATSSVDFETDAKIQQTIIRNFKGKTLLCIAHRLKTVIGYDKVCVMDAGNLVEMGVPLELWERGGVFRGMCDRSGIGRREFVGERSG